jgi:hypothetical protein
LSFLGRPVLQGALFLSLCKLLTDLFPKGEKATAGEGKVTRVFLSPQRVDIDLLPSKLQKEWSQGVIELTDHGFHHHDLLDGMRVNDGLDFLQILHDFAALLKM